MGQSGVHIFHTPCSLLHDTGPHHIESPARYLWVISALREHAFLTPETEHIVECFDTKHLFLCHDESYIQHISTTCSSLKQGEVICLSTGDVMVCQHSFAVATAAVNAAITAVDFIASGPYQKAFVIARPPGHHAGTSYGMGFCIFNTAAIAARYASRLFGRVAIIDWDAHHGNGTQEIFFHDPTVCYCSTHQANIFPRTGSASDRGIQNIFNTPLQPGPTARDSLLSFYFKELPRILHNFRPRFIVISCGFDAHRLDPISQIGLESRDYARLTQHISNLANTYCDGRLLSILEGGYSKVALQEASVAHISSL